MRRVMLASAMFVGLAACELDQVGDGADSGLPAADAGRADAGDLDSRVPDSRTPDGHVPDGRVPDGSVPDGSEPDSHVPDSRVPDGSVPDSNVGDVGAVDAEADAGADDAGACVDPPPSADRPVAIACSPCRTLGADPGGDGDCATHAECTDGDNGRCTLGMIGAYCSYDACFEDDDCASDQLCSCDGDSFSGANRCVPADCRINADCASGVCAPSYGCLMGGAPEGWYCRTDQDTCAQDEECSENIGGRCAYDRSASHWACEYGVCVP